MSLQGLKISMLGGDKRDRVLAKRLIDMGVDLKIYGTERWTDIPKEAFASSEREAIGGARVGIIPITGTDDNCVVRASNPQIKLTKELLSLMAKDKILVIGRVKPCLEELIKEVDIKTIETAENDEIAIYNSIPSAEGAIQMAMEATDITIWGSLSLVLGFGRTGQTVARMLKGIGSKVTVLARKPKDLARISEMGYGSMHFRDTISVIKDADFIFNTAPAMVLPEEVLKHAKKDGYILDLASPPGGVDFYAAEKFGIKAVLAPGLPGKVAPKTAGQILAKTVPSLIEQSLS